MNFGLTEEQQMVKDQITKFAETKIKPIAAELDLTHRHPEEICRALGEMGIMGVAIPTEYGGAGMDIVTYVHAMIAISKACASTGVIVSVNNSLYGYPVNTFGTHEQKLKYLTPVAGGKVEGCYALTEAGAGSDAASLACRATLKGDKYILNGTKRFITNGNVARYCVLACTTDPALGYKGVINLIVDLKETKGFSLGKIEEKMGILASGTAELVFEDAEVPAANLLGKVGQGFKQMMMGLDCGRIGIGSQACGIGKAALEDALNYAKERVQFGKPIASFQTIQEKLANMYCGYKASRWMAYSAAAYCDSLPNKAGGKGTDLDRMAAASLLYCGEVGTKIGLDAIQIHGGYGYCTEYGVTRHFLDQKLWEIGAGTSEIRRMIIARELMRDNFKSGM